MQRNSRQGGSTSGETAHPRHRRSRRLRFQTLELRLALAAEPIITEFMASNDDSLLDDNGNSTDWIELFNTGDQAVDLAGYSLTDDPAVIDKWVFPSVTLAPNDYLIVFAGDDLDPENGSDLYTGSGLSADGEYLGLYDPIGVVLSAFEPGGAAYPAQAEDISYGLPPAESFSTVLNVGDNSLYLIPNATTGPQLGDFWRSPGYVLGTYGESWQTGPSGYGYEQGSGFEPYIATDVGSAMYNQQASLYVRSTFTQDVNAPFEMLKLRAQYDDGFIAYLNGVEVLRVNGPQADPTEVNRINLDNLFDDAKGSYLAAAIQSDTYQAEGDTSDLGVWTVIDGGLDTGQIIAPGVVFNLANAGGSSSAVNGKPSNDTFRSISTDAIRTIGSSNPGVEKVEDGIGMHANELITFDLNEIRTAGGFVGADGYFTARSGVNDSAGTLGSIRTVAILSNSTGQVIAGYVNGQRMAVTQSGGQWLFTGSQADILDGGGGERIADKAIPIPPNAAYLTLATTSNGSANSDHGVFSGAALEFNTIALGNLFDDARGVPLSTALGTDTAQATADATDLGIAAVVVGRFQSTQTIAPDLQFNLSNLGTSTSPGIAAPSNDTWGSHSSQPIRTRDVAFAGLEGVKAEDGLGLPADSLVTFDIEELRTAGGYASDLDFRFSAKAAINDDVTTSTSASGHAVVVASDAVGNVVGAWINGQTAAIKKISGVWSVDFSGGAVDELTFESQPAYFDVALPNNTAFLTLIGAGGAKSNSADHIVFSAARLQAVPDADGVSWDSTAGASHEDGAAVQFEEFDLSGFIGLVSDGVNVLAIHALNRQSDSSDFLFSHEIIAGDLSYDQNSRRFFTEPTPRAANGEGVAGLVARTTFSVVRGFYDSPFTVEIHTPTDMAEVYYTTDFSLPGPDNPSAELYNGVVPIDKTTVLRAAAFKDDYAPSYIDTTTYIFIEDVLTQDPHNVNGAGVSPDNGLVYPTTLEGGITADLALDPEILAQWDDNNPANTDFGIRESLLSLPSFSLTMEHGDAWRPLSDPFPGILTDARNRGEGFRHAASIEYLDPATGEHFQANAAVQAQGNSSRGNGSTRQHSYRLIFNKTLGGPGKLYFPLFDNSDFADINTFTLKVASTDGFSHDSRTNGSTINPLNSTYTRDAYIRQLHFNTGNPAADHTFAHVYINGLYWGLYIPIERPDDAFFADRFGGQREDWDVFRDNDEFISGNSDAWNQMTSLIAAIDNASPSVANDLFQQLQGRNPDGSTNPNIEPLMDVDNFIDYVAIHFSSNVNDWPHRNWYAARNRVDPGKGFRFIAWDQGQSLAQDFIDRTERQGGLGTLHRRLRNSSEYELRFADRIQKHFFNDGALTLERTQQTWAALNNTIEKAIIAETARWGDSREGEYSNAFGTSNPPPGAPQHPLYPPGFETTVPTLTIDNWRVNVDFVHDEVLPFGRPLFFERMLADSLWTALAAPVLSINGTPQHGGKAAAGSSLGMTGPGALYFTTDGSDPRAVGGGIAGNLFTSDLPLNTTTVVKARTLSNGQWSPLTEATFVVASNSLVISEFDYHPADATPAELAVLGVPSIDSDEFEFIEVTNYDPVNSVALLEFEFRNALEFTFPNVVLGPGESATIVENQAAFEARYGTGLKVVGVWSGGLSNSSDKIELLDATDAVIDVVAYDDGSPWPESADGGGFTLTRVGPTMDGNLPNSWIAETPTPGAADFTPALAGDYDRNGGVDQNDYQVWKSNLGSSFAVNADGNGDGRVNLADYTVWRNHLGAKLPTAVASFVVNSEQEDSLHFIGLASATNPKTTNIAPYGPALGNSAVDAGSSKHSSSSVPPVLSRSPSFGKDEKPLNSRSSVGEQEDQKGSEPRDTLAEETDLAILELFGLL